VATFGFALIGEAVLQAAFDIDPRSLDAPYATAGITVVGVRVQAVYLIAFALSVVLCVGTHAILTWTRAGTAVRAASADPVTASLLGINVDRVYAATFAGSAALAAAAGVMVGVAQSFTPSAGTSLLLIGFAVMALGGIGSVAGSLLAGLALGLFQSIAVSVFGGGWRNFVVYAVFFVALAARPNGLFRMAS
jgi:branched-chain amino acid transport system permease protein